MTPFRVHLFDDFLQFIPFLSSPPIVRIFHISYVCSTRTKFSDLPIHLGWAHRRLEAERGGTTTARLSCFQQTTPGGAGPASIRAWAGARPIFRES